MKIALAHIKGDLYYSLGIFLFSIIININDKLKYLDPICVFIFSYIVCKITFPIFKESITIIMEKAPDFINIEYLK